MRLERALRTTTMKSRSAATRFRRSGSFHVASWRPQNTRPSLRSEKVQTNKGQRATFLPSSPNENAHAAQSQYHDRSGFRNLGDTEPDEAALAPGPREQRVTGQECSALRSPQRTTEPVVVAVVGRVVIAIRRAAVVRIVVPTAAAQNTAISTGPRVNFNRPSKRRINRSLLAREVWAIQLNSSLRNLRNLRTRFRPQISQIDADYPLRE